MAKKETAPKEKREQADLMIKDMIEYRSNLVRPIKTKVERLVKA